MFTTSGQTFEVLREGDPIDLDGNGLADEGLLINKFYDYQMSITDQNYAYIPVDMYRLPNVNAGAAILELKLPLPSDVNRSDEVDAADIDSVISQFGSITPGIAEDVDGSGEVDAADIDMVIGNFGRAR